MDADSIRSRRRNASGRKDPGRLRLLPIGWALTFCFATALIVLAGLTWLALALLHYPKIPATGRVSLHDFVSVLQLVFASVAGAGALVALVMAYRRQRVAETASAHDRSRVLNERFTTIAEQLGSSQAAIRLAGIHAMAGLADDWEENRQTCIDVICAYLRMPYAPEPPEPASPDDRSRLAWQGFREVRHSAIRIIGAHLRDSAEVSWQGRDFDFTGVVFDGGNFRGAVFSGGTVSFSGADFRDGRVDFHGARFSGSEVSFGSARFSGASVDFGETEFSGGRVHFRQAEFAGGLVDFGRARFAGAAVSFWLSLVSGGLVDFSVAEFSGSVVGFDNAKFTGGRVSFQHARFTDGEVVFLSTEFAGADADFLGAQFSGGTVSFRFAQFSQGTVSFRAAGFCGAAVSFANARLLGGSLNFAHPAEWSTPPVFDWPEPPPPGVTLPGGSARAAP